MSGPGLPHTSSPMFQPGSGHPPLVSSAIRMPVAAASLGAASDGTPFSPLRRTGANAPTPAATPAPGGPAMPMSGAALLASAQASKGRLFGVDEQLHASLIEQARIRDSGQKRKREPVSASKLADELKALQGGAAAGATLAGAAAGLKKGLFRRNRSDDDDDDDDDDGADANDEKARNTRARTGGLPRGVGGTQDDDDDDEEDCGDVDRGAMGERKNGEGAGAGRRRPGAEPLIDLGGDVFAEDADFLNLVREFARMDLPTAGGAANANASASAGAAVGFGAGGAGTSAAASAGGLGAGMGAAAAGADPFGFADEQCPMCRVGLRLDQFAAHVYSCIQRLGPAERQAIERVDRKAVMRLLINEADGAGGAGRRGRRGGRGAAGAGGGAGMGDDDVAGAVRVDFPASDDDGDVAGGEEDAARYEAEAEAIERRQQAIYNDLAKRHRKRWCEAGEQCQSMDGRHFNLYRHPPQTCFVCGAPVDPSEMAGHVGLCTERTDEEKELERARLWDIANVAEAERQAEIAEEAALAASSAAAIHAGMGPIEGVMSMRVLPRTVGSSAGGDMGDGVDGGPASGAGVGGRGGGGAPVFGTARRSAVAAMTAAAAAASAGGSQRPRGSGFVRTAGGGGGGGGARGLDVEAGGYDGDVDDDGDDEDIDGRGPSLARSRAAANAAAAAAAGGLPFGGPSLDTGVSTGPQRRLRRANSGSALAAGGGAGAAADGPAMGGAALGMGAVAGAPLMSGRAMDDNTATAQLSLRQIGAMARLVLQHRERAYPTGAGSPVMVPAPMGLQPSASTMSSVSGVSGGAAGAAGAAAGGREAAIDSDITLSGLLDTFKTLGFTRENLQEAKSALDEIKQQQQQQQGVGGGVGGFGAAMAGRGAFRGTSGFATQTPFAPGTGAAAAGLLPPAGTAAGGPSGLGLMLTSRFNQTLPGAAAAAAAGMGAPAAGMGAAMAAGLGAAVPTPSPSSPSVVELVTPGALALTEHQRQTQGQ